MAGVTSTGFERKTLTEILAELRATIDPNIVLSTESPEGQLVRIVANALAEELEVLEALYATNDPDRAEGDALESNCRLSGTARRGATKSTVTCTVNLDGGTTLEAGTHFAAVLNQPSVRFTPREDVVAAATGPAAPYEAVFEAEVTGAVEAITGTLTVVATPVSGWNNVMNARPWSPTRSYAAAARWNSRAPGRAPSARSAPTSPLSRAWRRCWCWRRTGTRSTPRGSRLTRSRSSCPATPTPTWTRRSATPYGRRGPPASTRAAPPRSRLSTTSAWSKLGLW
jgi:hypothetical protein